MNSAFLCIQIFLGMGIPLFAQQSRRTNFSLESSQSFPSGLAGMIITAVIQSSSLTTVLVVGLICAGLLTLSQSVSQSIGVIIGANVGTTITAQIIAFRVHQYGRPRLLFSTNCK